MCAWQWDQPVSRSTECMVLGPIGIWEWAKMRQLDSNVFHALRSAPLEWISSRCETKKMILCNRN